jgi:Domain of unknown function (DUF5666)
MPMLRRVLLTAAVLCGIASAASAQPMRIRGTVQSLTGDSLVLVPNAGGTLAVVLTDKTGVSAVMPSSLGDIKPGSYVGTAAMPGKGGTLVALEVHVFPEAMRGAGDGHRPFDLQPESTMTNGTVGDVTASTGTTLTMTYKGGQQTVQVPDGTPIVTFAPGGRELLAPGAHVIVFADKGADGKLTAARVLAGKDGLVPPM